MPALPNPKHERYAQLIFISLCNGEPKTYSQSYIEAGYRARDTDRTRRSAQASSSRLLSKVIHRVRELQAQAAEHTRETADKVIQELNEVKRDAKADKAYAAAVSAIMGKAKILNLTNEQPTQQPDFKQAKSMQDVGRKLLQSVGFREPDDVSIQEAIAANDEFIKVLCKIRDDAQRLMLEHDE
jgi:Terminase small subunit